MRAWRQLAEGVALWNLIRALNDRLPHQVVSKVAAYTATTDDQTILADAVGAAFQVTLPTPVGIKGKTYTVKRLNAGANAVTVAGAAGLIDGAANQVLAAQWAKLTVVSDNANYMVIG